MKLSTTSGDRTLDGLRKAKCATAAISRFIFSDTSALSS